MELFYYKNREGNVGDDLNPYLWKRLIPDFEDRRPGTVFLGIGTILTKALLEKFQGKRLLIFGSGSRGYYPSFRWSADSEVSFVRGPLSAAVYDLPENKVLSDPAYALGLLHPPARQGKKTALVPHYSTLRRNRSLPEICKNVGIELVSPCLSVVDFLARLSSCKHVIAEAMHGAIIADALRIPWTRISMEAPHYESEAIHEFKWFDWTHTIGLRAQPMVFQRPPSNRKVLHALRHVPSSRRWADSASQKLGELKHMGRAQVSSDARHAAILECIREKLAQV